LRNNDQLEILISDTLHKNVFGECYLVLTKSHAIDRLKPGDRLVGHPWTTPMSSSSICLY